MIMFSDTLDFKNFNMSGFDTMTPGATTLETTSTRWARLLDLHTYEKGKSLNKNSSTM